VILRDYVTSVTALVFGFAHPLEHYATAGSERFVSHVCISFLGINAAEVPIFASDTLLLDDVYTIPGSSSCVRDRAAMLSDLKVGLMAHFADGS
jgi:hypothetical protein